MRFLASIFQSINALSIDIAIGAVCTSRLLYFALDVPSLWYYDLLLGFTVWLIYTVDHLIDAVKIEGNAHSFRHRLHQKYFIHFSILTSIVAVSNAIIAFRYLTVNELFFGIALFLFCLIHQYLNLKSNNLPFLISKESRIAFGYTLGISFIPILHSNEAISIEILALLFSIYLIAILNLLLFGLLEYKADSIDNLKGIGVIWSKNKIKKYSNLILVIAFLSAISYSLISSEIAISIILFCMLFTLLLAFRKNEHLSSNDLYRVIGDGVFILPFILIWL